VTKKVGLVLPHLHSSQIAFFGLSYINNIVSQTNEYDFAVFYQDLLPACVRPNCAIMNYNEIWTHNGLLIATNLDTADACLRTVSSSKTLFYVNDLEWLRKDRHNFLRNINIYRNVSYLVCRSEHHAKQLQHYCNRKADAVISLFNLTQILDFAFDKTV